MRRTLIAGFGSVLHGDDGFGVEVAHKLEAIASTMPMPAGVEIIEVGTGGIHLVQRLLDGFDTLLVLDTVRRGGPAGTLHLLEAEVPELDQWDEEQRRSFLADMHYAEPGRALILAKALKSLPRQTLILGCEPQVMDDLRIGLSAPVARAVNTAVDEVRRIIEQADSGSAVVDRRLKDG